MGSVGHLLAQAVVVLVLIHHSGPPHAHRAVDGGTGTRLDENALMLPQKLQILKNPLVLNGKISAEERQDKLPHKARLTADSQPIRLGIAGKSDILHGYIIKEPRHHAQQHARSLSRLHKEAVHIFPKKLLQAEGNTPRGTAYAARQVYKQGMVTIHHNMLSCQLPYQHLGRHRIAQEQLLGVFIIHKITALVSIRLCPAFLHSIAIVALVLNDGHALAAEQILLPLPGIAGHVDNGLKPKSRSHDADGQPQVACRAHLQLAGSKKLPCLLISQLAVVILKAFQDAVLHRQDFRMLHHLIDAAPGLHRASHRQMAVQLHHQPPGNIRANAGRIQCLPELRHLHQVGVNQAVPFLRFREQLFHQRSKAAHTGIGRINIRQSEG